MKTCLSFFSIELRCYHALFALAIVLALPGCGSGQPDDPLTRTEREWLQRHDGKITLAEELSYPPFVFVDENDVSRGLAAEYVSLIEEKLNFRLRRVRASPLRDILERARNKEFDVVNAVTETPARSEYLLFTKPFIEVPNVIVTRSDRSGHLSMDVLNETRAKVSLVDNYAVTEWLVSRYNGLDVDLAPDDLSALLDVSFGKTKAAVVDLATASYLIEKKGITNLRLAGDVGYPIVLCIASRKDLPILNIILGKGLASITKAERNAIRKKWIYFGHESFLVSKRFWAFMIAVFSLALLLIATISAWNRILTRRVEQRTVQLKEELAERERAEDRLRENQVMLRQVLDTIPQSIFWKDRNGIYLGCNLVFARAVGLANPDQVVGKTDFDLPWPREDAELRRADDAQVITSGTAILHRILPLQQADGTRQWVDCSKMALLDAKQEIRGVLGIYEDITDRKRIEEERTELQRNLHHAQKLESLGLLASGIAHDFNNLLTAIMGNTELAMEDIPPDSTARHRLESATRASRKAADLTRQMLAYSGKGKFVVEEMDINELIQENIHFLRSSIPKTIVLNFDPARDLPHIVADTSQLQQVVMNLITNAADAIGEHAGTITLATGMQNCDADALLKSRVDDKPAPGSYVYLEVADTGCGMSDETQKRAFDAFYTTKRMGRGLGMSAIKGILSGHKGAIFLDSKLGCGTTVRVLFPASLEPQVAAGPVLKAETAPSAPPSPQPSGTILIVDDEDSVRDLCSIMLTRIGYRTVTAADGQEAVRIYRKTSAEIACVILDVSMPKMDGYDACLALKQIRPDTKVILSSGYSEEVVGQRFAAMSPAGFIQKPFRRQQLEDEVRRAISGEKRVRG